MRRAVPLPAAALSLLLITFAASCSKKPAGPALVLVTVEGLPDGGLGAAPFLHELARVAARFESLEAPADVFEGLAAMHAGVAVDDLPAPPGAVDGLRPPLGRGAPLSGNVDTWLERAASRGFETAAVVSRVELGLASGLTQGAVHVYEGDDTREAFDRAVQFLDARLGRRREHAPVMWLHLDLDDLPPAEAGDFLDASLARLSAALEADPHHVFAVWFLPEDDGFRAVAPLWVRGPGSGGERQDECAVVDIAPTLAARLGVEPAPRARPPFAPFAGRDLFATEAVQ